MSARPSPPPRKKSPASAPPLRAVRRDEGVDAELSKPTLAAPSDDGDPTKGEWLFKHNEMVLGPVTAIVLVERIKAGELSADTPIARDGQPFKPMKLVPLFREAYEATLELKRRIEEERAHNAKVRRARVLQVILYSVMVLVPAVGGAAAGRLVMIKKPWDKTPEWIAKAPPLVDLPPPAPAPAKPVTPTAPVVAANDADSGATEPDRPDRPDHRGHVTHHAKKDDGKRDKGKDKEETSAPEKDQGFVKELTNAQAIAPLKEHAVRSALGSCFKNEVETNPDMPTPLNLAYTITEQGRSANVEITNREERGRPIQSCVKKALALARWPRFEGERKNVTVPFNIRKPKPAATHGPVEGKHK